MDVSFELFVPTELVLVTNSIYLRVGTTLPEASCGQSAFALIGVVLPLYRGTNVIHKHT